MLNEAALRLDAATALPNFFAFLRETPEILATTSGIALLLDLIDSPDVNARAQPAVGEEQIAPLAAVLGGLLATGDAAEDGYTVECLIQTVEGRAVDAKRAGKDCVA
ncbi:MAG: hypothetical protein ACR2JY_09035 [Chloroflexota bacterium]